MQRPGGHHRGVPGRLPRRIWPGGGNKPPKIPRRDCLRGLYFPAVPDEGWLWSHPRDPDRRRPAGDGGGGGGALGAGHARELAM